VRAFDAQRENRFAELEVTFIRVEQRVQGCTLPRRIDTQYSVAMAGKGPGDFGAERAASRAALCASECGNAWATFLIWSAELIHWKT